MKTIKFDTLCALAIGTAEITPAGSALYTLAWDLDSLRERLAAGATTMASRFDRYAKDLAEGFSVSEPPTGYSTLRDLERDSAAYEAKLAAFRALFPIATGKQLRDVQALARAAAEGEVAS